MRLISKNEDWPDFSYTLHKDNQSDSTVSVGTVESRNVRNVERRICKVLGVLSIQHLTTLVDKLLFWKSYENENITLFEVHLGP